MLLNDLLPINEDAASALGRKCTCKLYFQTGAYHTSSYGVFFTYAFCLPYCSNVPDAERMKVSVTITNRLTRQFLNLIINFLSYVLHLLQKMSGGVCTK